MRRKLRSALIAVGVVLLVWFLFFRGGSTEAQTLVISHGDFIEKVAVSGTVVAPEEVDLGFTQSGRIAAVYVKAGSQVAQGQTLMQTDNGDLRAAVTQRQAALAVQEAKLAALKVGTRPEEVAVAQTTVINAQAGLKDALYDAYSVADAAVHKNIDQFFLNPRGTNPQLTFQTSDLNRSGVVESDRLSIDSTLDAWSKALVFTLSPPPVSQSQAALAEVSKLLSDAAAALARAIPTQSTSQATINGYVADVAIARTNINNVTGAITTAEAALKAAERNLELKRAGATLEDIRAQEAHVQAAYADVVAAQAALQKTILTAPFAGIVSKLEGKVGKITSPSSFEVSLISRGTFQLESFVPEVNIAKVEIGQEADVVLDAYGDSADFKATVVSVEPGETKRDGVSNYKTVLQFVANDPRIRSGMTATVEIVVQKKPNTISIPRGAVLERDSQLFVRVRAGDEFVEKPIVAGLRSLGQVEVTQGLVDGDEIALDPIQ